MAPELSIILVNYNERDYLRAVLTLLKTEFPAGVAETIVVDNDSRDSSAAMVQSEFPEAQLIEPHANLMYGKGNNLGLETAKGTWLMILNPDVSWGPGALHSFFQAAKKIPNLGTAGPQVRYPDQGLQVTSHQRFPNWLTVFTDYCLPLQQLLLRLPFHPYLKSKSQHMRTHQTATLTGVCLLLPRQTLDRVGKFDPDFTMYLEETDWQKRMDEAGLARWFLAEHPIVHYGSAQKSFSQASPNFLWGLELYTRKHWSGPARKARLLSAIWLGTIISLILLLALWPFSWLLGRGGRRIRHYLSEYSKLGKNLLRFPQSPPAA